jgi:hypothetical protein
LLLGLKAYRAAIESGGVPPEEIEQAIFGNAQQTTAGAICRARAQSKNQTKTFNVED